MLSEKSKMITMCTTTKAMIKLFVIINGKRWRFFFMKRTACLELSSRTGQLHPCRPYYIRQAHPPFQIIQKRLGNQSFILTSFLPWPRPRPYPPVRDKSFLITPSPYPYRVEIQRLFRQSFYPFRQRGHQLTVVPVGNV